MPVCPECGTHIESRAFFPFCSERCRCLDLSRWIRGDFVISTPIEEAELRAAKSDEDEGKELSGKASRRNIPPQE